MKMDQNSAGNHFWHRIGLAKTMVCWTRFPLCKMLSFSMGKLTFLEFRNRTQKEHEKTMKMEQNSVKMQFALPFCLKTQCLLNAFPLCKMFSFSMGKLTFCNSEIAFSKHCIFKWKLSRILSECNFGPPLLFKNTMFAERVFRFAKC